MPTFGFAIEEIPEEIREELDRRNGMQATRAFKVPWASRLDFAQGMLSGGGVFGTEGRIYQSAFPNVRVQRALITPIAPKDTGAVPSMTDPETQMIAHTWAKVELSYATNLEDTSREERADGTWVTYDGETTLEYMTIPGRALKWESDDDLAAPDVEGSVIIAITRHRLTWHNVASPDWDAFSQTRGKVNDAIWSVPALGISAPAETMLFEGYSNTSSETNEDGDPLWAITLSLIEKRISQLGGTDYGWNHTYREGVGWDRLLSDVSGDTQYALGDLDTLFTQA